ncbi:hypothetical protein DWB61_13540 [Ancylomarina euxinus]|uniref:DoxX family protein n=1 Tax=Ancylomarina euxinus TaxID=2283627 RepID=A0A425XYK0_9BACT|nr:DoxX family protein [Ancylomarina euxinus]MCZ4695745.1 DoxX family protein [Ancylomarina euxinus]MUP16198.1 hypothetical protein [Ancylomarina euxinus]RRG20059.1 hypothetical protein DWB61_13540 [Ancylomarina euxinus]
MMLVTAVLYFVFYDTVVDYFTSYGYPIYLIYPLALAKIMGSLIILSNKNKFLKELAYMGFFYNLILAFFAHLMINEFDPIPTLSLILLFLSYFTGKKVRP